MSRPSSPAGKKSRVEPNLDAQTPSAPAPSVFLWHSWFWNVDDSGDFDEFDYPAEAEKEGHPEAAEFRGAYEEFVRLWNDNLEGSPAAVMRGFCFRLEEWDDLEAAFKGEHVNFDAEDVIGDDEEFRAEWEALKKAALELREVWLKMAVRVSSLV